MYIDTYTSRCKIFRQIPRGSKVLEIGCGSGRLANILSLKKNCQVYCVDKDPAMAGIARNKCVEVLNIDIEESKLPYEAGFFDSIILGNVLEHMREPSKILADLGIYLSRDGFLIYSVPNIVNWHSRLTIFSGRFEYAESGVFDKTHLRFYNLNSAKKIAHDAGYRVTWLDVTPSIYLFKEDLNFLWYGMATLWKNLFADEFIIKAIKA
ncbi:methylase involved in ubiquinone/menaquinone biosynthesis [Candidatus Methanoperedens nitroreducens]|uniref:Methylase involved in ubiquinone/menaquinone biosynthesis n=1 Tax=Candidatus Methanoperedens nitratireducens TaxID=1392998 RepID=A0A062VAN3_9EURY|nr:class I SAM-dependent methyltransferase [Candidatus Methanoperedens nitroreducens]KCZ73563.1 methylase involved in ubiquinone/menaquinone biosynthesis [Candidatus Methanoperedens nitroreducens]MDJ1422477.1 class I SAM-dependent methyltransferase [Candidatus Methanoperedens sp.]